jgi:hypothetical protein
LHGEPLVPGVGNGTVNLTTAWMPSILVGFRYDQGISLNAAVSDRAL